MQEAQAKNETTSQQSQEETTDVCTVDENERKYHENYTCRFYRNEYPEVDDLVVVQIIEVNDDGAYV